MKLTINFLTFWLLVVCAVQLVVGSFSPVLSQPLRQAVPGYDVLGGKNSKGNSNSSTTNTSVTSTPGSAPKGQLKTYRTRKSTPAISHLSPTKQAKKINSDVLRYYNEGLADEKNGNLNGAIAKLSHSLALREYYWRHHDTNIPTVLQKIAEVYEKQKKYSEAAESLEKSLTYYTKVHGPGTAERTPSLMMLGRVLQEKGDSEKSFEYFKQAYVLIERSKGKDAPQATELRLKLARLAAKCNWDQTAAEYYQSSIDLDSPRLAPAELTSALEEYSSLLVKLGKDAEAKAILARAHTKKEKVNEKEKQD